MGDEYTCPACKECGWFTLHLFSGLVYFVRCQNCAHQIVMRAAPPLEGHAEPHFDENGICTCDCGECTVITCGCPDCPCESMADHVAFETLGEDD